MGKGKDAGVVAKFPPLREVREKLKVKWYRCPMPKGALTQLSKRSDAQGLVQAGGHLTLWIATGTAVWYLWRNQQFLAAAIAMFFHGTLGSCFGYAVHELGHGTVFATKWLNSFFLVIYSLPLWWDPYDYASSHTYHHRFSQYPEADRENIFPLEPSLNPWLLFELFTVNLTSGPGPVFGTGGLVSTIKLRCKAALGGIASEPGAGSHEWLEALHADQPSEAVKAMWFSRLVRSRASSKTIPAAAMFKEPSIIRPQPNLLTLAFDICVHFPPILLLQVVLFHALVLSTAIATGEWLLVPLVSLHCFVGNAYSYFVGSCQHCGLKGSVPDFRKNTRSIILDPFSEFLFWRMNWHIEHHMYASVPCYNLKALHKVTATHMPKPRTLIGAWREMRATWLRQQEEPGYEYDTPVPEDDGKQKDVAVYADEGADSIGDLAPASLELKKAD